MTRNQIDAWRQSEQRRSNLAQEAETNRANVARETETLRHNKKTEQQQRESNRIAALNAETQRKTQQSTAAYQSSQANLGERQLSQTRIRDTASASYNMYNAFTNRQRQQEDAAQNARSYRLGLQNLLESQTAHRNSEALQLSGQRMDYDVKSRQLQRDYAQLQEQRRSNRAREVIQSVSAGMNFISNLARAGASAARIGGNYGR